MDPENDEGLVIKDVLPIKTTTQKPRLNAPLPMYPTDINIVCQVFASWITGYSTSHTLPMSFLVYIHSYNSPDTLPLHEIHILIGELILIKPDLLLFPPINHLGTLMTIIGHI